MANLDAFDFITTGFQRRYRPSDTREIGFRPFSYTSQRIAKAEPLSFQESCVRNTKVCVNFFGVVMKMGPRWSGLMWSRRWGQLCFGIILDPQERWTGRLYMQGLWSPMAVRSGWTSGLGKEVGGIQYQRMYEYQWHVPWKFNFIPGYPIMNHSFPAGIW